MLNGSETLATWSHARGQFRNKRRYLLFFCLDLNNKKLLQQTILTINGISKLLFYNECESRNATPAKQNIFQNRFEK